MIIREKVMTLLSSDIESSENHGAYWALISWIESSIKEKRISSFVL
jgi:hypothetical protein